MMRLSDLVRRGEDAFDVMRGRESRSAREIRAAYNGALFNRQFSDWIVYPLKADYELITDLRIIRTRCRDLGRNDPLATRYLQLLEDNVLGPSGIGMKGQLGDGRGGLAKSANRQLEDAWNDFCECVSVDGRYGMVDFSQIALSSNVTDGDLFIRRVIGRQFKYGFALELFDPDRVDERYNFTRDESRGMNEIRLSIEVDPYARPVRYWCYDDPSVYGIYATSGGSRFSIDARDMIHLGRSRRAHQTRYVPWFHPVMVDLRHLLGGTESELVAWRVAAAKMGWLVDKTGNGQPLGEKTAEGTRRPIPMEASPGSVAIAPRGYEFQGWDPQHPNARFGDFHTAIVRRIASGLGVAFTSLANDPGDANYSSGRNEIFREQRFYKRLQQYWIRGIMRQVLDWFLEIAPLTGNFDLPADPTLVRKVRWEPPGWESPDPKGDAEAAALEIANRIGAPQRYTAARGLDYETDVVDQLRIARELCDAAGLPPPPAELQASRGPDAPPTTDTLEASTRSQSGNVDADAGPRPHRNGKNRLLTGV